MDKTNLRGTTRFKTALGEVVVAWGESGIQRLIPLRQSDLEKAVSQLSSFDKLLGDWIKQCGSLEFRINSIHSPFQALLESIVYQQLTGKAAATIFSRLTKLCGSNGRIRPFDLIRVEDEELRGVGLSRQKIAAARDLAEKTIQGLVPALAELERMTDDEIIGHLTQIKGIGRWSVQMMLIFRLGRPDVLACEDLGLRKGVANLFRLDYLPSSREMNIRAQPWKPWRTVAALYLWKAAATNIQT